MKLIKKLLGYFLIFVAALLVAMGAELTVIMPYAVLSINPRFDLAGSGVLVGAIMLALYIYNAGWNVIQDYAKLSIGPITRVWFIILAAILAYAATGMPLKLSDTPAIIQSLFMPIILPSLCIMIIESLGFYLIQKIQNDIDNRPIKSRKRKNEELTAAANRLAEKQAPLNIDVSEIMRADNEHIGVFPL